MARYICKRLLLSIPLLLGITFVTFLFIHLAPGDFLDNLRLNPQVSPETIKIYQTKFNLDKPFIIQYLTWLGNIFRGDFGESFAYKAPVLSVIASRAFNTFILSFSALVVTWVFVIPLGMIAAFRRNSFIDKLLSLISYLGISTPSFFLAFILLYFVTFTHWLPLGGMRSINFDDLNFWQQAGDIAKHLVIPTIVLAFGNICVLQRIMRANLLDILSSHYILGARARGISEERVLYVHALRNSFNLMITILGQQLPTLLSGAALIEIIVGWPGLGVVTLEAGRSQDLYLIMSAMLMGSVLLILGNLMADIMRAYFDPRVRYEK